MAMLTTGRIPVRLTPLVGRETELSDVVRAMAGSRLLTLTGPGGTGKTRLALAAAGAAGGSTAPGSSPVAWVELAPVDDPDIVAETVAGRLGVPETPGQDAAEAIAGHVSDQPVLVVLDNCEHLAAATAVLAERLLSECPALSILATSREPLGVEGERSWPVPPLADADATRLFEQRAQLVAPSFRLTDDNSAAVRQVCSRLDRLPLAIELAAARTRMLSVQQLAERLDDIFRVLTGGARSAPRRHQALRATLDWSYDLLAADERAVFRRLAVFSGGFTLTAAEQVAAGDGIGEEQVLDLLTRLADKSLLRVEHVVGGARYHLLATIRDYARERLAETGEENAVRRAHLRYFAEFASRVGPLVEGAAPADLEGELDRLDAERPNFRTSLDFARQSGDAIAALRIVGHLGRFAYLRGHYHEVRQWMDSAVSAGSDAPAGLRAKALLGSGRLALLQCDYGPAVRRLEAALRLYRELDDPAGIASALQVLGSVAREQGRYTRSVELHAESLAVAESAGDRWAVASAHGYLGFVSWLQGDFPRAVAECTAALGMFREFGDVEGIAWSLISLGTVARYQGDESRASALLTESRTLSESIGFREGVAWSLEQLGLLASGADAAEAVALLRRSYEVHSDLRDRWRMSSVLEDLAAVTMAGASVPAARAERAAPAARAALAARLLGAAGALRQAIGTVISPSERAQHDEARAAALAALGDGAFETEWQRGLQADGLEPDLAATGAVATGAVATDAGAADVSATDAVSGDAPAAGPPVVPATAVPVQAAPAPPTAPVAPVVPAQPTRASRATGAHGAAGVPASAKGAILVIRTLGAATVQLGDLPLTAADWGYAKPRELLFLLATSPPMTRDQLGNALWPDQSRQQLGNALHTALRELRRALGNPAWVVYADGRYSFNRSLPHDCDVDTFTDALAAARCARPASAALPDLQRAVAVYGGDFLAGMVAGDWAQARRDELSRSFESALLATGRLQAAAGRLQAAVTAFRRAIAHEPLNESAHRELMGCWDRMGETARAVRHYEELVTLLQEQVGVGPAPETRALYQRLLAAKRPSPGNSP